MALSWVALCALVMLGVAQAGRLQGDLSISAAQQRRQLRPDAAPPCYQGCFVGPNGGADPLPIYLMDNGGALMTTSICRAAAAKANVTFFAIIDTQYCFGGNSMAQVVDNGFTATSDPDVCPVLCGPGENGPCGAENVAVFFAVAACSPAKAYNCKNGTSLLGTELEFSRAKMPAGNPHDANAVMCRARCDGHPQCVGFWYKTTGWCYLMGKVVSFTKPYSTSYIACKPK